MEVQKSIPSLGLLSHFPPRIERTNVSKFLGEVEKSWRRVSKRERKVPRKALLKKEAMPQKSLLVAFHAAYPKL
jgi:hypothetical protein